MKFRLLRFVFILQCIVLARTQFITIPVPDFTIIPWTSTSNTAEPPTPTTGTAQPPTTMTSTAQPPTPTTSTAEPPTPTTSTAEPPTPTTSSAQPPTSTTSTAEPPTPTTSTAESLTPTTSTAESPTPTTSTAQPPTTTTSTAQPPTPTTSTAEPPTTMTSTDQPPTTSSEPTTSISTSTQKPITCPEKQSAFYKDDLSQLIEFLEGDMKVVANLNNSFYGNVKNIVNDLKLELNTYLMELEDQPNHLITVLDEIEVTIKKHIVPLVKTANTTLNELLSVESANAAKIFAKMALLLTEKYKAEQFCKYACDFSFRALDVINNRVIISDDNYLCSTITEVLDKIKRWFLSFMDEQSKYIAAYINQHTHEIKESIGELKEKLSETSQNILGESMVNVLHLHHDVLQAVESIEDFNAVAYKYRFGVINANLSMLQFEFEKNILLYRKECVKCDAMAFRIDVSEKMIPKPDILDQLLGKKSVELEDEFHGIINSIFSDLYEILHDDQLVDETIRKLKPLVKDLALRTTQERTAFDNVMQSAPVKDRERLAGLYNETEIMFSSMVQENEKLKNMIHDLS